MIINRKDFEEIQKNLHSLSEEEQLQYSNPCITNNKDKLRVGEVFDEDLGYWREAMLNDF